MKSRIRTAAELAAAVAAGLALSMTGHPFDNDRPVSAGEAAALIETETAEVIATP